MPAPEALDPIHDVLLSMIAAGMDEALVRKTLEPVRRRWAGSVYIRATDPAADAEIIRRLEAGEHPAQIAKAVGKHRTSVVRRRSRWLSDRGPR